MNFNITKGKYEDHHNFTLTLLDENRDKICDCRCDFYDGISFADTEIKEPTARGNFKLLAETGGYSPNLVQITFPIGYNLAENVPSDLVETVEYALMVYFGVAVLDVKVAITTGIINGVARVFTKH